MCSRMHSMITIVRRGVYRLLETKNQTKILILDGEKTFAWVSAKGIGEILVTTHRMHKTDTLLGVGYYRMYQVQDEPNLSDQIHIELSVGLGMWQGYLLPTNLPTEEKLKKRIIPTQELITVPTGLYAQAASHHAL